MIKLLITSILILTKIASADATTLQKAKTYKGYENISGWYMSEKLDGIRGYWNGRYFLSKNGNKIHTPKWFTKNFPSYELDGELWSKRGDFENIQSIVLDDTPSKHWREISYHIFEAPNQDGNFTKRLEIAKNYFAKKELIHVQIIKQIRCKDKNHLNQFMQKVIKKEGEGVIIKDASLLYFAGRSSDILKVKQFSDLEGVIIDINKGKGMFKDLMGSLTLRLDNGVIFKLGGGFTIQERKISYDIGTVVTFKHYGFTKNKKPKFASFLRVRGSE